MGWPGNSQPLLTRLVTFPTLVVTPKVGLAVEGCGVAYRAGQTGDDAHLAPAGVRPRDGLSPTNLQAAGNTDRAAAVVGVRDTTPAAKLGA